MRKLVEITSYFQIIRGSVMRYTNYSCFKRDNIFFGGVVCTYRRKKSSEHYIVFIDHFVWMSDVSFFLHKFNEEKKWPCTDSLVSGGRCCNAHRENHFIVGMNDFCVYMLHNSRTERRMLYHNNINIIYGIFELFISSTDEALENG